MTFIHWYWDQQLVDLIQYRFPLDFNKEQPLQSTMYNHASALDYITDVERYLSTELQHETHIGHFSEPPYPTHISPLMTRPKQGSAKRRATVDLSWPSPLSVDGGVSKYKYLDTYFKLQYPSINNITHASVQLGPGAMLYKVDISHTFRHIRIDSNDIELLGLGHEDIFLDVMLLFAFLYGSFFYTQ